MDKIKELVLSSPDLTKSDRMTEYIKEYTIEGKEYLVESVYLFREDAERFGSDDTDPRLGGDDIFCSYAYIASATDGKWYLIVDNFDETPDYYFRDYEYTEITNEEEFKNIIMDIKGDYL